MTHKDTFIKMMAVTQAHLDSAPRIPQHILDHLKMAQILSDGQSHRYCGDVKTLVGIINQIDREQDIQSAYIKKLESEHREMRKALSVLAMKLPKPEAIGHVPIPVSLSTFAEAILSPIPQR